MRNACVFQAIVFGEKLYESTLVNYFSSDAVIFCSIQIANAPPPFNKDETSMRHYNKTATKLEMTMTTQKTKIKL